MLGAEVAAATADGMRTGTVRSSGRHAVRMACTRPIWRSSWGETGSSGLERLAAQHRGNQQGGHEGVGARRELTGRSPVNAK